MHLWDSYISGPAAVSFSNGLWHHLDQAVTSTTALRARCVMPLVSKPLDLDQLDARLSTAPAPTVELLSAIAAGCPRLGLLRHTEPAAHLGQMIEQRAWTDAVFTLLALELPQWQLRRLVYDCGEWHCALSRQREMPEWLDQSIEAHHPDLPMAILRAFVAVRQMYATSMSIMSTNIPDVGDTLPERVCCDNFA
jgi:hypothetical protein